MRRIKCGKCQCIFLQEQMQEVTDQTYRNIYGKRICVYCFNSKFNQEVNHEQGKETG